MCYVICYNKDSFGMVTIGRYLHVRLLQLDYERAFTNRNLDMPRSLCVSDPGLWFGANCGPDVPNDSLCSHTLLQSS